jgi:hypothetical protein
MKRRVGLGLTLAVCAAAEAAEPALRAPAAATADVGVSATPPAATNPARPAPAKPATRPLNLTLRDVRNYMLPDEYAEALGAPDADQNTVVVEGKRELLPSKSDQPVPGGIMAPFWGLAHPLQIWRLVVPDPKLKLPENEDREPADKVPPPIFRWGP